MHQGTFPEWLPEGAFLLETDESGIPLAAVYEHASRLLKKTPDQLSAEMQTTFRHFLGQAV